MIKSFLAGAVAGAAVMWVWGDRIRESLDDATMGARTRASEGLHGVADTLQTVAETVDRGPSGTTQPRAS